MCHSLTARQPRAGPAEDERDTAQLKHMTERVRQLEDQKNILRRQLQITLETLILAQKELEKLHEKASESSSSQAGGGLLEKAVEFDAMASAAITQAGREALESLAARFRTFATERINREQLKAAALC
jgi:hypothetical protein